jgi:hypothetical protein
MSKPAGLEAPMPLVAGGALAPQPTLHSAPADAARPDNYPGRGLMWRCSSQSSPAASSASWTRCHAAPSDSSRRMRTCPRSSGICVPPPSCLARAASSSSARPPGRVTQTTIAVSGTRADRSRGPPTYADQSRRPQYVDSAPLPGGAGRLTPSTRAEELDAWLTEEASGRPIAINPQSVAALQQRLLIVIRVGVAAPNPLFVRGAVGQPRPWRCARARPGAAARRAPGTSCDGRARHAGQRARRPPAARPARASWPPCSSAPRRPTSRGASPASALLGSHLADGERPVAKPHPDLLELLPAPLGRALALTAERHRLR